MNIHVHIERLVLDGVAVDRAESPRLQAAVESRLARLLAEGGIATGLATGAALTSVGGGACRLQASSVTALGHEIAQAVYGGIGR